MTKSSVCSTRNPTLNVLLAEPSERIRALFSSVVRRDQFALIEARDGHSAWNTFESMRPAAVLSAWELPGLAGADFLARVRRYGSTPFAFHSTDSDVPVAVSALRAGANDFFVLPDEAPLIPERLATLLALGDRGNSEAGPLDAIIAHSFPMQVIRERLNGIVGLRIPVLLLGEGGSGRSFLAKTLARAAELDLTVIPHACAREFRKQDVGRIVFLDGIDEFPLDLQANWSGQIEQISSNATQSAHRLILSSKTDLGVLEFQKRIDPELLRQIERFTIELPSLANRRGDFAPLTRVMLTQIGNRLKRECVSISEQAIEMLRRQHWPGNAVELESTLEKLVAFCSDGRIESRDVERIERSTFFQVSSIRRAAEREQREQLEALMLRAGGNLAEVARRLGVSRGAVIYRAQKFGLMAPRRRSIPR